MLAGKEQQQQLEDRRILSQRCLERVRNVIMGDERVLVSIDSSVTMTQSQLPAVMSDSVQSQVIDVELMTQLCFSKTINWCRTVRPLYPLRIGISSSSSELLSAGSRDSLLVAMTTLMWGSADAELVALLRRLVYDAMTQSQQVRSARLRERCCSAAADDDGMMKLVGQSDAVVVSRQMLAARHAADGDDDNTKCISNAQWQRLSGVFSEQFTQQQQQQKSSDVIRQIHVFVLCSVLRRPIIVLSSASDSLCGLYLPALQAPVHCCRSPLVVVQVAGGHLGGLFVPLLPRAPERQDVGGLSAESGVPLWRADVDEPLLVRCLLDSESAELAVDAYLRVIHLPHTSATTTALYPVARCDAIAPDINIVDELMTSLEPTLQPATDQRAVGEMTALEQMTANLSTVNNDAQELKYRPCQTVGCQYYALQQHDWKCSRCYGNESTTSQSASSAAGHVTSSGMVQSTLEEREPRWNAGLTTAVMCAVPHCSQPLCNDSQLYCLQHASPPPHASLPNRLLCLTTGCSRPASDKYTGLCANCYVTAAISPSRDVGNRRVAVATQHVTREAAGRGGSSSSSCIMDFCSNVGSAECKGLCRECFSAVCQTRLQTAADPPPTAIAFASTASLAAGSESSLVARGPTSVKCMMEGCRVMVPADSDVCTTCRRKQIEAYEDAIRGYR